MSLRSCCRLLRVTHSTGCDIPCLSHLIRLGHAARHISSGNASRTPFPVIEPLVQATSGEHNMAANMTLFEGIVQTRNRILSKDEMVAQSERAGRKLTVRERIRLLKDGGTDVLELSMFAGLNMPYGDVYNASSIVAIATISGELCVISANDWTFKGGSIYPITVKKQLRAQEIAMQNKLPCIYLVDSGGAFLPLQADVFPDKNHGGRIFRNQAVMSVMGIPQVSVVCGPCTAGGAYIPTMSDEAVIVKGVGSLYLGGPPLVKAATGDVISSEELGGADVHCRISGCTDHYAATEEEALSITRLVVACLNLPPRLPTNHTPPEPPLCDGSEEDFARLIPAAGLESWPVMEIIARLVDGSRLHQFKEKFGTSLCTGFARINGHLVGLLANNGELSASAAIKGTHFIQMCTQRGIPLLFLQNTLSDAQFLSETGNDGTTVKARAQMMAALACSRVPKITVVMGGSYGPTSYAMCGRAMQPNFLFCWPHARVGVAQPEHILEAQNTEVSSGEELGRLQAEEQEHPTSNMVNDGLILPHETRQVLSLCLDVCLRSQGSLADLQSRHRLNVLRM